MKKGILVSVLCVLIFAACRPSNPGKQADGAKSSSEVSVTNVVSDETFAPVVDDEVFIFESDYVKEKVNITYKPEVKLLNELMSDSTRIVIMSRDLTAEESKFFMDKKINIRKNRFAIDGVAIISNTATTDSIITVDEIMSIMRGKSAGKRNLVFDNANSSTVRYLKELSGVKELPSSGVYALTSNPEVIKYVYNNVGAIGVVGINWIDQADKENVKYLSKVRLMGVKNQAGQKGADKYYLPDQNNLALGLYPLTRNLYIINVQGALSSFAAFIAGEKGQRIVLKSGLMPDKLPPREVLIKN
jgi:phosphate transport system substrate-binding protein